VKKVRILLVEDDELASELIYHYLQECDFEVEPVFTATESVAKIKNEDFDLLLLDINLPDFDGFEVLKGIKNVSLPIIVISAYNNTKRKLMAFKYGANDYMTKPLDLEELEARIWLQLGQNSKIKTEDEKKIFEIKDAHIYFKQKQLDLTTIEYEILSLLIENKNHVMRREDLVLALSSISSNRSLDNHIKNIRKKIGDNGNKAIYLKTEYGVGYILKD
jgi:DNA-binding response OmpR family regulator